MQTFMDKEHDTINSWERPTKKLAHRTKKMSTYLTTHKTHQGSFFKTRELKDY
jgi:hypothetical protein